MTDIGTLPLDIAAQILEKLGHVGLWLQTVGIIIILWIAFQISQIYMNRKRGREIKTVLARLDHIEKKLDQLVSKKKK